MDQEVGGSNPLITIGGKQIDLQTPDKKAAYDNWHQLAVNPPEQIAAVPRLTARELLARFLEWAEKRTRPATYYWYSYFLKSFARKLPTDLAAADVRAFHVTQWMDARKRWGVNGRRSAIKTVKLDRTQIDDGLAATAIGPG